MLGWSAFVYVIAQHTFTFYLVTYLYEHCGLSIARAGFLLSALAARRHRRAPAERRHGRPHPAHAAPRLDRHRHDDGCIAIGLLAADTPFWLITLVVVGYGSVVISWNGTSQAEFAHLSPPGEAAAVAAVQTALAFSGAVFGPPLFALIASLASYRMAFFAVAACVLVAAPLADRGGAPAARGLGLLHPGDPHDLAPLAVLALLERGKFLRRAGKGNAERRAHQRRDRPRRPPPRGSAGSACR